MVSGKTILVPATGDPTDPATLAAALTIARTFSAHIDMLHVRAGFTHQRSRVDRYARSGNCKASPTLRGAAASNPKRIVAKRI